MAYTIAQQGDPTEKRYWAAFASAEFPSYETFWRQRVVPLTQRPASLGFMSAEELAAKGYRDEDVATGRSTTRRSPSCARPRRWRGLI